MRWSGFCCWIEFGFVQRGGVWVPLAMVEYAEGWDLLAVETGERGIKLKGYIIYFYTFDMNGGWKLTQPAGGRPLDAKD